MKKLKFTMILLTIGALLTACGSQNSETSGNLSNESERNTETDIIEIRFSWWGDTLRHEIYNTITDLFEEENPDVRVIREPATWSDYWTRLSTQSAGNNAPTVFGMHPQFVSDYALRNVLMDLQPFVSDGTIDTTYISDPVLDSGKVRGTLYGMSQGVTFRGFVANMTLLDRFDIETPSRVEDWTWDEFVDAAMAFTDATREAGETIYFSNDWGGNWEEFKIMALQSGGGTFNEDGLLGFDEEALVRWFTIWNTLRDYGSIPDPATSMENNQQPLEQRLISQGKMALAGVPVNQLSLYQDAALDYDFDLLRSPSTPNQVARGEFIEGAHLSIANGATPEQQEAAARLINFFINTEQSLEIFLMEQGAPPNERLGEHIQPMLTISGQRIIDFTNALLPVASSAVHAPLGASEVDQLFLQFGERVAYGQLTPEDAARSFMEEATAILERN